MENKILWGAASSSSQYEGGYRSGGKGLTTCDVITGGSRDRKRMITWHYKDDGTKHYSPVGAFWGKLEIPEDGIPDVFDTNSILPMTP